VDAKISESKKQFDELEKARRAAETRQAEIEKSQPEEKKGLSKIKEDIRSLIEKRSTLQKDLGRLEAQIELAQATGGGVDRSSERLLDSIKKIKAELDRALHEEELEMRATIEAVLEEIDMALEEKPGKRSDASSALRDQLQKLSRDLSVLEAQLASLREKEVGFEEGQEGFYKNFKAIVAEVQAAKNRIGEWENKNREHLLEKERLDLRREEILRQISQAGRRADEFAHAEAPTGMREHERDEMERRLFRLRGELAAIGEVDEALMKEARDTEERYAFLAKESEDLEKAVADLGHLMQELSDKIKTEFDKSLSKINDEFNKFFGLMFGGGSAKLKVEKPRSEKLADEGDEIDTESAIEEEETKEELVIEKSGGVNIDIKLPRKKITSLDMLSGGERSLVGIAALFAMVAVSPPPFLVLDEIDAPLDERNARRFGDMLKEFSKKTQFVVVTHNRATMEAADILYGVTLDEDGTSKIVSLKLEK